MILALGETPERCVLATDLAGVLDLSTTDALLLIIAPDRAELDQKIKSRHKPWAAIVADSGSLRFHPKIKILNNRASPHQSQPQKFHDILQVSACCAV